MILKHNIKISSINLFLIGIFCFFGYSIQAQNCGLINAYGNAGTTKFLDDLFYDATNNEFAGVGRYGDKMFFTKTGASGNAIFTKIYDRRYHPTSIIKTGSNFLILADSSVSSAKKGDIFLMRTDNAGQILWSKRYSTPNRDRNAKIIEVGPNQYFILFNKTNMGTIEDLFIIKVDGSGSVIWKREYNFGSDDEFYNYIPNGTGGVVMVGGLNSGTRSGILVEVNGNGTISPGKSKRIRNAQSNLISEFSNIIKTTGGYLTTGEIPNPTNSFSIDLSLKKFDTNFNLLWNKTITVNTTDYPFIAFNGLSDDASGNFYVCLKQPISGGTVAKILKFSSTGAFKWAKELKGISSVNLKQINNASSNNIILYGNYSKTGAQDSFLIARTDTSLATCLTVPSSITIQAPSSYTVSDLNYTVGDSALVIISENITESSVSLPPFDLCNTFLGCNVTGDFTFTSNTCVGQPIQFTNLSRNANAQALTQYKWNFGEGTIQSGVASPVFSYSAAGTYLVTLIVGYEENCNNCYDTVQKQIIISTTCGGLDCEECIGSFAPIPGKKYVISAWAKEANAPATKTSYTTPKIHVQFLPGGFAGPFSPKGLIIDGWQRIEEVFTIPSNATNIKLRLTSTSGDVYYDDIRIFPFDGNMKSFVYDPVTLRLSAELDEQNYATFYEYDEEGKLVRVKKETEKGVMTIQENKTYLKK